MNPEERLFDSLATASTAVGRRLSKPEFLEITRAFIEKEFPAGKRPTRKKTVAQMTDEEWVASLEAEPALAGVDIRREIGKAQFWAKQNGRTAVRRFLINWLNKAERVVGGNFARDSSRKLVAPDVYKEPDGWQAVAERLFPGVEIGARAWLDLPTDARGKIIKAML